LERRDGIEPVNHVRSQMPEEQCGITRTVQHTGCWKPVWFVKKVAPPSAAVASCEYGFAGTAPTAPADNGVEAVTNGSKALVGVMVPFPFP